MPSSLVDQSDHILGLGDQLDKIDLEAPRGDGANDARIDVARLLSG